MSGIQEKPNDKYRRTKATYHRATKIILFGSYAYGTPNEDVESHNARDIKAKAKENLWVSIKSVLMYWSHQKSLSKVEKIFYKMERCGMNKTSAKEWLVIAFHDLQSAKILYEANHYTDSIGNDLQQSIEKILKSCC